MYGVPYSVVAGESVEFVFDGVAQDLLHGVPCSAAAILRRFFSRTGRRRESMTSGSPALFFPVGCLSSACWSRTLSKGTGRGSGGSCLSCQFLLGDARQFVGQFPVFVQLFGVHAERGLDRLSFGDEGVEARGVGLLQRG